MHHSPSQPPRGGHPVTSLQRTVVGIVLFTLVMAVVMTGLLYPPVGLAVVVLTAAVVVGRFVRPRLRRLIRTVSVTTGGSESEPRPGSRAD